MSQMREIEIAILHTINKNQFTTSVLSVLPSVDVVASVVRRDRDLRHMFRNRYK